MLNLKVHSTMENEFMVVSFGIRATSFHLVIGSPSRNCTCAPAVTVTSRCSNPMPNALSLDVWRIRNDWNIVYFCWFVLWTKQTNILLLLHWFLNVVQFVIDLHKQDREDPYGSDKDVQGLSLDAKFASQVDQLRTGMAHLPNMDGFVFSVDPLFQLEPGIRWFLQVNQSAWHNHTVWRKK